MRQSGPLEAAAKFLFGYDLFISYARFDASGYAQALADDLARLDYSSYLDREDLPGGEHLRGALTRALRRSKVLVLIGTRRALASPYIDLEVRSFLASSPAGSRRKRSWRATSSPTRRRSGRRSPSDASSVRAG